MLEKMEAVETDNDDKPLADIKLLGIQIFVNPFDPAELEKEKAQKLENQNKANRIVTEEIGQWFSNPMQSMAAAKQGVGKYMKPDSHEELAELKKRESESELKQNIKHQRKGSFDFSGW